MSASPPEATELMRRRELSRCAMNGLMHCNKRSVSVGYSLTSSASASSLSGTSSRSALAVLRLITSSNLLD
jgi:hypothetical protein